MIRENLKANVVELLKDVKVNKGNISNVELVFNGNDFDFCVNYHGVSFIRPSNSTVVDITEEVKHTITNDDIDYLVALISREIEDTLFFLDDAVEMM